jgi:hypothetical protein
LEKRSRVVVHGKKWGIRPFLEAVPNRKLERIDHPAGSGDEGLNFQPDIDVLSRIRVSGGDHWTHTGENLLCLGGKPSPHDREVEPDDRHGALFFLILIIFVGLLRLSKQGEAGNDRWWCMRYCGKSV